MPAVILAGGQATRLRPLTEHIPKALVEVAGHPFLYHQLTLIKRQGIRKVVLAVGHLGEAIQKCFGDGSEFGMSIEYSFDGPVLLGTGGAIRQALPLLPERFFVLYGDSYLTCDYRAIETAFRHSGHAGLMTVYRNDGMFDSSNVEYDGLRILRYDKQNRTAAMNFIDYGLGAFERRVFESIPPSERRDLADVYQDLLSAGELAAFEVHQRFYEIGSLGGLRDTADFLSREAAASRNLRRAVFLDRDGVLNEAVIRDGKPYPPAAPADVRIIPGTAEALAELKKHDFLLLVVTNQPDVARGTQTRGIVEEIDRRLLTELPLDGVFACYHDDSDACDCRKPKPGLLMRAAQQYGIDLSRSYLTGDRWRDIDAGANAGCRTIWIDRGYAEKPPASVPDARVASLPEAVEWILNHAVVSV